MFIYCSDAVRSTSHWPRSRVPRAVWTYLNRPTYHEKRSAPRRRWTLTPDESSLETHSHTHIYI